MTSVGGGPKEPLSSSEAGKVPLDTGGNEGTSESVTSEGRKISRGLKKASKLLAESYS